MSTDRPTEAWRDWPLERREREYSPSSAIGGDYAPYVREWIARSEAVRRGFEVRADLPYGPGLDERFELVPVPGERAAPLLIFLHGGYWQEGSRLASLYPAAGLVPDGIAFAAVGYRLAPAIDLAGIVDQVCRALARIRDEGAALGIDPARVVVAGHSAGAQLAAMALLAEATAGPTPVARPRLAGGLLVSGVFELEPLIGTSIDAPLGLDPTTAQALSPRLLVERTTGPLAPVAVTWGEVEPSEFGRQSRELAAAWVARGGEATAFEVAARNHFDIVLGIGDPTTEVGRAARALLGVR
jgi:arylformamidase